MTSPVVVILAAGQGTRMRSETPKLLHPLCGRQMIAWPVAAAREAGASQVVVVDNPQRRLDSVLDGDVAIAIQEQPRGTADAVRAGAEGFAAGRTVVVLYGDVPLIAPETIRALAETHEHSGAAATIATAVLDDPTGYGRVIRAPDGTVERVVETKAPGDATELELHIREVNTGVFAFDGDALLAALAEVRSDNAQGELYLPDVLPVMRERERTVGAYEISDHEQMLGINDRVALAQVAALAQRRIQERLMLSGVTIVNPAATTIDVGVKVGQDTVIAPFCSLHGATSIGPRATIGPLSTLIDARVGAEATVLQSHVHRAEVGDRVSVGPYSYLRPGTVLRAGSKAGAFVEMKNSDVGRGREGPSSVLHRRHGHRRAHEHRRRHDHRQLRRHEQAPDRDRRARVRQRRHDVRRAGQPRRRRLHRRRLGDHPRCARRERSAWPAPASETSRATPIVARSGMPRSARRPTTVTMWQPAQRAARRHAGELLAWLVSAPGLRHRPT